MKTEIELDHKVLQKNLELTKALQTVDRLTSDNVQYKDEIVKLKKEISDLTQMIQIKMFTDDVLEYKTLKS